MWESLIVEAENAHMDLIRNMIRRNFVGINAQNQDGDTALHLVCAQTTWAFIELFVENGADVMIKNKRGETPLMKGITTKYDKPSSNDIDTVLAMLIDADRRCVDEPDHHGNTPLIAAVKRKAVESLLLLSRRGANVAPTNDDGDTAFDVAFRQYDDRVMRVLASVGAHKFCKQLTQPTLYGDMTTLVVFAGDAVSGGAVGVRLIGC